MSRIITPFELPWDGLGSGATPARFAAVSSEAAGWTGAALLVDRGDGALVPLGSSGRARSVIGRAVTALGAASPHLVDRYNSVDVWIGDRSAQLAEATMAALANGANRALLGSELIQFGRAEPLGGGIWRLAGLLRGRGGTEPAVAGHVVDEAFVLLGDSLVALDPGATEPADHITIAALGGADADPVTSPILFARVTRRPLAPVHGRAAETAAGGLALSWTRRARGAWQWPDRIDTPLNEQAERYAISGLGDGAIVARWETAESQFALDPAAFAELFASHPAVAFVVRQLGDADVSPPLTIPLR